MRPLIAVLLVALASPAQVESLELDRLAPEEITLLESALRTLEPRIVEARQQGTANLLTWQELLEALPEQERSFVERFRALKAEGLGSTSHYFGEVAAADLVPVGPQAVTKPEGSSVLDPQYLPQDVRNAYEAMMAVMERDLGRRLLVESGYRSPAYQLYLFLFYLPKHDYSIRETNRHVALPGYSEHGYPPRQAIDFINQDGINGEDRPEEFEALPEYRWLLQYAERYGFSLSYPRDNPYHTAFEPWHWHYERHTPRRPESAPSAAVP